MKTIKVFVPFRFKTGNMSNAPNFSGFKGAYGKAGIQNPEPEPKPETEPEPELKLRPG